MMDQTIYQFSAYTNTENEVSLREYKGKVVMIVNIATACGRTPQLEKLEALYKKYQSRGFEILAFPSNQFAQEPREGEAINEFCKLKYGVSFPVFRKINVRGKKADPLFQFFANRKLNGKFSVKPMWNFYKYIVGRDGKMVDYFISYTSPDKKRVMNCLEKLLAVDHT